MKKRGEDGLPEWEWTRCVDIEFKPVYFCISNTRHAAQGHLQKPGLFETADRSLIIARYVPGPCADPPNFSFSKASTFMRSHACPGCAPSVGLLASSVADD